MPPQSKLWAPGRSALGETVAGLLLPCAQCSASFPTSEFSVKDGLCLKCLCTRRCQDFRNELVRLYKKRERLIKVGASPKSNDEQAERVRKRILKFVTALTPNQELIQQIVNEQGRLAREQALANSRIRLPAFGGGIQSPLR